MAQADLKSSLKLNDAFDALPRMLDQARAENISMTAALERLLEIEVEATESRTVAAAMLDRLLHRAAVVGIDGPSYRLRHHQNRADSLRQGVNARVS